ncbi:unnamed protein product, partial [Laminaria digitata]
YTEGKGRRRRRNDDSDGADEEGEEGKNGEAELIITPRATTSDGGKRRTRSRATSTGYGFNSSRTPTCSWCAPVRTPSAHGVHPRGCRHTPTPRRRGRRQASTAWLDGKISDSVYSGS